MDFVNPLTIPHFVITMFENNGFTNMELLNMRAVCKDWNSGATKAYENQNALKLDRNSASSTKMYGAITLIQDPSGNFPIPTRIQLDSGLFFEQRKVLHAFQRLFTKFLSLISGKVEDLELIIKADNLEALNFTEFTCSAVFVKLKRFFFNMQQPYWGSGRNYFIRIGMRVLAFSPILEEVNVYQRGLAETSPECLVESKIIRNIPRTVQKVAISKMFTVSTTHELANLVLPNLNSLSLRLMSGTLGRYAFCQMFENCSETLTDLAIRDYAGGMQFPVFPQLKTLTFELWTSVFEGAYHNEHGLQTFSKNFPQVETLNMNNISRSVMESLFPVGFFAPQVKNCELPDVADEVGTMLNFAHGFSKLKRLDISPPCTPKILSIVFEFMTGLEELTIYFRSSQRKICVDSVLTGIPTDVCKILQNTTNWDDVKLDEVKTCPGLSNLRQLRSLRLRGVASKRSFITDVTGFMGFLKTETPVHLRTDRFSLSEGCIEELKSRFGDTVLYDEIVEVANRSRNPSFMESFWLEAKSDSEFDISGAEDSD